MYPGEKDRMNARLSQAVMDTMWLCMVVRKIITVLRPVTPTRMGTNGSKINNADISMLKYAYSG